MIVPFTMLKKEGIVMENVRVICKTDADILLQFEPLKDSGFIFEYAKKENGIFQRYVNCNGTVYGPYEYVYLRRVYDGTAEWSGGKGDIEFKFKDNGKDCWTEKRKRKEGNEVLSQDEIDQLLTSISEGEYEGIEEEYDEKTHVLKLNRKKQEFFITDKKKYGPDYSIYSPLYQNESCFQFIFRKSRKSKNWYYNFNGSEIGPFKGTYLRCIYDERNRAVVDQLGHYNFILINGEKVRCFREAYYYCRIHEKNEHQIIVGEALNRELHFKRDGIMADFAVRSISVFDNGDVVYSKILDDTETWFYNDKQISVPVKGYDSDIYDSIITYKRNDLDQSTDSIPYFMVKGKEYNGMPINDYDEGFVYLDKGAIQFFSWSVIKPWEIGNPEIGENYSRYRNGMFLHLYYLNQIVGID